MDHRLGRRYGKVTPAAPPFSSRIRTRGQEYRSGFFLTAPRQQAPAQVYCCGGEMPYAEMKGDKKNLACQIERRRDGKPKHSGGARVTVIFPEAT